ncbi:MAG: CHAT domain-containing protein, partial [Victivallales bacterium]|nr:CHAT domain-containing protein [Victivallales bacterium]
TAFHNEGYRDRRDSWRRRAKREGVLLHEKLFSSNTDLLQKLGMGIQAAREPENLSFCFSGPRNHLGMPYELLCDAGGPLAVRHPLFRQVVGIDSRAEPFADLLTGLRHKEKPLNVLLLASDTGGIEVDAEIDAVAEQMQEKADQLNIRIRTVRIHTGKASIANVQKVLSKCPYHIVHYAGHAEFSPDTGENSGLRFWAEEQKGGETQRLTARALAQLMQGSKTSLFFLSCCVGATVGGGQLLRANEYLGVMDALVQARVPAVLGYRWNVTDAGARTFATEFYDGLFETRSPAQAALRARRQIYMDDATDETWTSPILVMQKQ